MTTTVIFDLDGVLVDSRAVFLSCVRHAFAKLGLPERTDAELLPYIGPPFAYAFGELLDVPHDAPIVAACIDGYRERYKDASLTETTVTPGIPEALASLDGHRLAVATSKPHAFADPLLAAMGLREHFEVVVGPDLAARTEDKTQTIGRALRGPRRNARGDGRRPLLRRRRRARQRHPGDRRHLGDRRRGRAGRRRTHDRRSVRAAPRRSPSLSRRVRDVFTLYNISLWLHISAAVVGLGATFALSIGFPLALKIGPAHTCRSCTT